MGAQRLKKSHDQDMTSGSIVKHLLIFMLPLMLGNVFQQLYNTVDTWVIGNYATNEAFSAVGAVTPIINMLIGAFIGLANGAGVVISHYYGAGQKEKVSEAVHTSIVFTAILTVAFTIIGIAITPAMLRFMNIPDEVYQYAYDYLTIYFAGTIGLLFYNIGSSIMRAVGDSRRPFIYLVVSAVINTVLDLLFVAKFNWGVKGVAYATIIAQFISAVLTVISLMVGNSQTKISLRKMKMSMEALKQIIRIGIPAALQMAITSFSNVFVQSYINYFGPNAMSSWTVFNKLDSFLMLPISSLALTITTFVGQNIGNGQTERARKGTTIAFLMSIISTVFFGVLIFVFAPELIALFNAKPEVVEIGTIFIRWINPFYFLVCMNQIYSGSLRGAGYSTAPMVITLLSFVAFRQIYMYVMANFIANNVVTIGLGYPVGWMLAGVIMFIFYLRVVRKNNLMKAKKI